MATTLISEMGEDLDRFPTVEVLLAGPGLAPVTEASGLASCGAAGPTTRSQTAIITLCIWRLTLRFYKVEEPFDLRR